MDPKTMARIFEPFFTTKSSGRGTGLGLATVQEIVKEHGGHITVESKPGHGATFHIYLPSVDAGEARVCKPGRQASTTRTAVILLVEDELQIRAISAEALREAGHTVLEAANGGEALTRAAAHEGDIDLLLSDVTLPQFTGVELAEILSRSHPRMRVMFMSGDAAQPRGRLKAPAAFLHKPFTPSVLIARVREALSDFTRHSVLVVDDDPGIRNMLGMLLSEAGYTVRQAADGLEAVEEMAANPAELVLIDLVMPNQEGLETIRALREINKGTKIIAMSGAFGGQLLPVARAFGANALLPKPFHSSALLRTVGDLAHSFDEADDDRR
jgi:CheY-like chemotaxis protein